MLIQSIEFFLIFWSEFHRRWRLNELVSRWFLGVIRKHFVKSNRTFAWMCINSVRDDTHRSRFKLSRHADEVDNLINSYSKIPHCLSARHNSIQWNTMNTSVVAYATSDPYRPWKVSEHFPNNYTFFVWKCDENRWKKSTHRRKYRMAGLSTTDSQSLVLSYHCSGSLLCTRIEYLFCEIAAAAGKSSDRKTYKISSTTTKGKALESTKSGDARKTI